MAQVFAAIDDIFFLAKVQETAKQTGVELKTSRAAALPFDSLKENKPALIIIDLEAASADPAGLISQLKNDDDLKEVPVLAFGGHTQVEKLEAARQAGANQVMPRSEFTANLANILHSSGK